MDDGEKTHSWFIGFTNVDNPELVISVIIEGYDGDAGGKGSADCQADTGFLLLLMPGGEEYANDILL